MLAGRRDITGDSGDGPYIYTAMIKQMFVSISAFPGFENGLQSSILLKTVLTLQCA